MQFCILKISLRYAAALEGARGAPVAGALAGQRLHGAGAARGRGDAPDGARVACRARVARVPAAQHRRVGVCPLSAGQRC